MAAPPVFERRRYIDKVHRALTPLDRAHGALQESVVLWGEAGVGKRDIALQAAREICAIDGRILLVVDGSSMANLIATYLAAYVTFTGTELSRIDSALFIVHRIRRCLEQHRSEWLMVVLDMDLSAEVFCNGSPEFPSFLPGRGQLVFTTNTIARARHPPALRNAVNPTTIHVPWLSATGVRLYARARCPELLHMSKDTDGLLDRDCISPVDLNIIAANMRLLRCSYPNYVSYFSSRAATCTRLGPWAPFKIHAEILWDLLNEHDRWATRLLSALTFLNAWGIPTAAVQELPMFRDTISERLKPALDLLYSLHIITIDAGHISWHPRVDLWLRQYAPQKCPPKDWTALLTGWTVIMANALEPYHSQHPFRFMSLGAHALSLSSFLDVAKLSYTASALSFLTDAAQLPYITYTEFHSLLCDAFKISGGILARHHAVSFGNYYMAKVGLARARRYLSLHEAQRAELQLRAALPYMYRIQDDDDYNDLLEVSLELEARTHLIQGNFSNAERFLRDIFARKLGYARARTRRLLHHLMANALHNQGKSEEALKFSHAAMFYFGYKYKPDGRPRSLRPAAEVVDLHITLLVKFQKYRGALLYLVPTIEEMLRQPNRQTVVLDYAHQAVRCYRQIGNLLEAERLVIRILEADLSGDGGIREGRSYFIADEVQDDDLEYYMAIFMHLSCLYCSHGRFVEAEALWRYNVAVELHRFPGFRAPLVTDYRSLARVSYARGNYSMVNRMRTDLMAIHGETFIEQEYGSPFPEYQRTKDTYQRALWAAQDGCYGESWAALSPNPYARDDLCLAEKLWGEVENRVSEGRDLAGDIDEGGISHARKSRLLHMIGYDLVDLAFVSKLYPDPRSSLQNDEDEHIDIDPGLEPRVSEEPPSRAVSSNTDLHKALEKHIQEGDIRVGPLYSTKSPNDEGLANEERTEVIETPVPAAGEEPAEDTTNRHHFESEVKADEIRVHDTVPPAEATSPPPPASTAERNKVEDMSLPATFVRGRQPTAQPYDRRTATAQDFRLNIIDLWSDSRYQRTIPEYWPWCYCRRHRTRSSSINPIDLISKRFIREAAQRSASPPPGTNLIQKKITDCFIVIPPEPKSRPPGCHDQCPCIKANEENAREWSSYKDSFLSWPSDAPYQPRWSSGSPLRLFYPVIVSTGPLGPPGRFIRPHRPPPALPPEQFFTCVEVVQSAGLDKAGWDELVQEMIEQDSSKPMLDAANIDPARPTPLGATWIFSHPEFVETLERQDETYMVTFALDMPTLIVTLAEDEWSLPVPGRERFFWKEVELDVLEARGLVHASASAGEDVEACLQSWDWEGNPEWIKYTKGDVKGKGTFWILTKRKEFLTEYFERGAFGPSQRVESERRLEDMCHPIEPGMEPIEEEEEDERAQDADSHVDWERDDGNEGDPEHVEQPCPGKPGVF